MSKTAMIRARVEPDVKEAAETVFRKLGLSVTEAVTLFYKQVTLKEGLPFDIKIPNRTTRKAMEETSAGKGLTKTTLEELKREFDRA